MDKSFARPNVILYKVYGIVKMKVHGINDHSNTERAVMQRLLQITITKYNTKKSNSLQIQHEKIQ